MQPSMRMTVKFSSKKPAPNMGHVKNSTGQTMTNTCAPKNSAGYGDGVENPRTEKKLGCPYDCGICPEHKSHTSLSNHRHH